MKLVHALVGITLASTVAVATPAAAITTGQVDAYLSSMHYQPRSGNQNSQAYFNANLRNYFLADSALQGKIYKLFGPMKRITVRTPFGTRYVYGYRGNTKRIVRYANQKLVQKWWGGVHNSKLKSLVSNTTNAKHCVRPSRNGTFQLMIQGLYQTCAKHKSYFK